MTPRPVRVSGGIGGVEAHCDDMRLLAGLFGECAADAAAGAASVARHGAALPQFETALLDPAGELTARAELFSAAARLAAVGTECASMRALLLAAAASYTAADRLPDPLLALLPQGARLASPLWPDGFAVATRRPAAPMSAPRSVADLIAGLAERNRGAHGEIDVRILAGADGRRRVVVDIPGTKDWSLAPHTGDVTGPGTNVRALNGMPTTYEQGVAQAMTVAGVRPDDDVLLVGHSLGGMVAVDLAAHAAATGSFRVTHVVIAGAPIGRSAGRLPHGVTVLALENDGDPVPALDGLHNPGLENVVTVHLDRAGATPLRSHDLAGAYLPGAVDVDLTGDPSVARVRAGLAPFLTATAVETRIFVVGRRYR